jgi:CAAX prenyl protease-like protein
MFSAGAPERFYPVRVAVTAGALWHYRHSYRSGAAALGAHTWPVPLLVGLAVFVLWVGSGVWRAAPAPPGPTALVGPESPSWRAAWLLIRVVGSVVTVPLAEELAFRGFFARRLMAADFESVSLRDVAWPAALVSSALFGALHGMPVAGTVAGLAFLWAARRSGRLADAVIAHATANGLLAAYVLATQSWWLWA